MTGMDLEAWSGPGCQQRALQGALLQGALLDGAVGDRGLGAARSSPFGLAHDCSQRINTYKIRLDLYETNSE
jgi:hypothetical protein